MVADGVKAYGQIGETGDQPLTEEEKQELKAKRTQQETAARDQALRDGISGNKDELEVRYKQLKDQKDELQALFDEEHKTIVTKHHPAYTTALNNRATEGWTKLGLKEVYDRSTAFVKNLKNAIITGDYTHLSSFMPMGMTQEETQKYLTNQSDTYSKQNETDLENYELAQENYRIANNAAHEADRVLTDAIEHERGYIPEMEMTDAMRRQIAAYMNYLG